MTNCIICKLIKCLTAFYHSIFQMHFVITVLQKSDQICSLNVTSIYQHEGILYLVVPASIMLKNYLKLLFEIYSIPDSTWLACNSFPRFCWELALWSHAHGQRIVNFKRKTLVVSHLNIRLAIYAFNIWSQVHGTFMLYSTHSSWHDYVAEAHAGALFFWK